MTSIASLYRKQRLAVPSQSELKRLAAEKHLKNVANAREVLSNNDMHFVEVGDEFQVCYKEGSRMIRYWPKTGAWIDSKLDKPPTRFGIRKLIVYLKGSVV